MRNLKMWFENLKVDLVELFLTEEDQDGTNNIRNDKLEEICNLEKTFISIDGINGNRGVCPAPVFFNPWFHLPHKTKNKTSLTPTMIGGRTAEGKALMTYLQFQTKAQSDVMQRLRKEMVQWLPNVFGKFGCDKEKNCTVKIGMNKKGVMDDAEFEKYLFKYIIML